MYTLNKSLLTFVIAVSICIFGLLLPQKISAATLYWVGSDGANTSVATNWKTTNPASCGGGDSGAAPTTGDTVIFDADCDNGAVWDAAAAANVSVVNLNSGYAGTVTLQSSLQTSSTFTVAGGTFTAGANVLDVNGTFTLSNGIFNAPSVETFLGATVTISGGTFNANGGTVVLDGSAGGAISCNNVTFNLVQFNHTAGTSKTINSNCNLPLGNNPTVGPGSASLSGTLSGSGTINFGQSLIMSSGGTFVGFSGLTIQVTLTMNGATLDLTNYSPVTISNQFLLNSGTFTAPLGTFTLNGNFAHNGGTFNHNGGTLVWQNPSSTSAVRTKTGSTTFYNLFIINNGETNTRSFTAGTTQTILGSFRADGMTLNSITPGSQWNIDAQGGRSLHTLSVQDSNNVNSLAMSCENCSDLGNNINWFFSGSSPLSILLEAPSDTSYINTDRPTFKWRAASSTANASINNYVFQMDNGSDDTNWDIFNIPAYQSGGYATTRYRVQYEGFDDDNPNNNYVLLTTNSSNEWNPTQYDGRVREGRHSWKVSAFDTVGNSTRVSRDILLDTTRPTVTLSQITNATKNKAFIPTFATVKRQPTLFGVILDPLAGLPQDKRIASGPKQIDIKFEKKNTLGKYLPYSTAVHSITQVSWAHGGLVNDNFQNTSSKYSTFGYTPDKALAPGSYKVTLTGLDNVDNSSTETEFFLTVR